MSPRNLTMRQPVFRVLASILGVGTFAVVTLTAAGTVDWGQVIVAIDGRQNTFTLQAAGNASEGWTPSASSWEEGNPDPVVVVLSDATIGPGRSIATRVAVRNDSPRLGAIIAFHVSPPPMHNALFEELRFSVAEGGHVYADKVDAAAASTLPLTGSTAAGAYRILDLTVSLPSDAPGGLEGIVTPVRVSFTGVSG